jgi:hypothetical protein
MGLLLCSAISSLDRPAFLSLTDHFQSINSHYSIKTIKAIYDVSNHSIPHIKMDRFTPRSRAPPNTPVSSPQAISDQIEVRPDESAALLTGASATPDGPTDLSDTTTTLYVSLTEQFAQIYAVYVDLGHRYYSIPPLLPSSNKLLENARTTLRKLYIGPNPEIGTSNSFLDRLSSIRDSFQRFGDRSWEQMSKDEWIRTSTALEKADEDLDDLKEELVAAEFHMEVLHRLAEHVVRENDGNSDVERGMWDAGVRAMSSMGGAVGGQEGTAEDTEMEG